MACEGNRPGQPEPVDPLGGWGRDDRLGSGAVCGEGFRERTTWAAADDGFLVIDLNADGTRGAGDGKIDQAREIAFAQWAEGDADVTDLQALLMFDAAEEGGNANGVLDSGAPLMAALLIR